MNIIPFISLCIITIFLIFGFNVARETPINTQLCDIENKSVRREKKTRKKKRNVTFNKNVLRRDIEIIDDHEVFHDTFIPISQN